MIHVFNIKQEDHSSDNGYWFIGRPSVLGNPYTHNGKRSNLAKMTFKTPEEAIKAYELYFEEMYGNDKLFTETFDEIYEYYKTGKDVYLGCFCKPNPCHGDFIAKKLQQKLIKEKREELMKEKKDGK